MIRALAILVLASCTALAFPVRVSWEIAPAQVGVSYRVVRLLDGAAAMPLGETAGASLVVDARAGDKLAVIAFNAEFGEADPSEPVTVSGGRLIAVPMEASTDTKEWREVLVLLPEEMTENGNAPKRLFTRPSKR